MLKGASAIQFSGGGIGLKSAGILAQSAVPASVTGTTTPTVLATIAVPALSVNSVLRITTQYSFSGSAGNRSVVVQLNGVQARQFLASSSILSAETVTNIRNRNSVSSQTVFGTGQAGSGTDTSASASLAVNTGISSTLTLLGNPVVSTDTVTLEAYTVEILNP
jgi:hypothetical protein